MFALHVARIDEHASAPQEVTVTLKQHIGDSIEELVSGSDKGGRRLAIGVPIGLVETDPLVPGLERCTTSNRAVATSELRWDTGDLVPSRFA